jgi:mRNA-degrading endonuclease RelE of RelBE toxin-antitoxin system
MLSVSPARRGTYRIIYRIDEAKRHVEISSIEGMSRA